MLFLGLSSVLTIASATPPPVILPVTPHSVHMTILLSDNLTSSETRTILPIQMMLPDGTWNQPVKYNFGASWPTDVEPQSMSAFGYGPDGVGKDSSLKDAQPGKIRIVGLIKILTCQSWYKTKHITIYSEIIRHQKDTTSECHRRPSTNINGVCQ